MSDYHAVPVTQQQISDAIDAKRSEIQSIKTVLTRAELDLALFESLQRRYSDSQPDSWSEFLLWLDRHAPELVYVLKKISLKSFSAGKLSLAVTDNYIELVLLQRDRLVNFLAEYFELSFSVEIVNVGSTSESEHCPGNSIVVPGLGDDRRCDSIEEGSPDIPCGDSELGRIPRSEAGH